MEESSKETVCVTGAGGFLGSWIVNLLLQRGYNVRGTVRDVGDAKNAHLKSLEGAKERLKLLNAVLSDYDSLFTAINGCTGVFHTACPVPSHRVSNPEAEMVNPSVKGTLNVLKACSVAKVKRVIMTSSVVAVFVNPNRPMDALLDESCWSDPEYCEATENWYFMSKTVSEKNAWNCSKEFGLDLITICPSLILGPMLQPNTNASCLFIIKLLTLYPSDSSPVLKVPFGTRTWKHILCPQGLMTQEYLPMLESRERFPSTQRLRPELSLEDRATIEEMGLRHVLYVPEFRVNMGLLTALAERWHSETCTFHLPMGEMTVTLEDVYRIMRIPIDGELIPYDRDGDRDALGRVF